MKRRAGVVFIRFQFVAGRILLVAPHQHVDVPIERRRKEKGLAVGGSQVEEAAHVGKKSHVGHTVGFVYHHDLHCVEADAASFDEIAQPAGTGHGYIHTP